MVTGPGQRSQDLGQWCKEDVAERGVLKWGQVSWTMKALGCGLERKAGRKERRERKWFTDVF